MEWTELILEHIVQIIHYMAWPAVVLIILLLFRKELGLLAGRLEAYEGQHGKLRFSTTSEQPSWKLEEEAVIPEHLSKEAKKILATLWERQIYHFKDDYSKRWSFPNIA